MTILVIGTGAIGKRHSGNLDAIGEDVETISMRHGGIEAIARRISKGGIEAAFICSASQLRLPIVEMLADQDIPFYLEKPVAYLESELDAIMDKTGLLADRCFAGFMMRYHPAVSFFDGLNTDDIYRFRFEIGHDVHQWRENWVFADSYAANPKGGGVLLDLCHELDMAQTILGEMQLVTVQSNDHEDHPRVDFSTQIVTRNSQAVGTVSMDYLSPISIRRFALVGADQSFEFDLASERFLHRTNKGDTNLNMKIDRQEMFKDATRDFLSLVRTGKTQNPNAPILANTLASNRLICQAYAMRDFIGTIS